MSAQPFTARVAAHFKACPGQWIDGRDLELIGGRYAWRSRVSDCRTQLGMTIENRQRRIQTATGKVTVSEYRYLPPVPTVTGSLLEICEEVQGI